MWTSMASGSPLMRAASGCSHVMMLPRSIVLLGALWNGMRLGRCRRTATRSSPDQPTLPTSFPAAAPNRCVNTSTPSLSARP